MVGMGEGKFVLFVEGVFASLLLAFGFGMFFDDGLDHFEDGTFQLVDLVDEAILFILVVVAVESVI